MRKETNHKICEHCRHYFRRVMVNFDSGDTVSQQTSVIGNRADSTDGLIREANPHEVGLDEYFCQIMGDESSHCPYVLEHLVLER